MTLEMLRTIKPHVLLMDLSLPEINGLEIVATVRGEPQHKNLEIIVATDRGGRREASILKGMGVNHFLTKPVDQEELSMLLRPLLERPLSISSPPSPPYSVRT
jgi:DNA-binding response OmpR family regulator